MQNTRHLFLPTNRSFKGLNNIPKGINEQGIYGLYYMTLYVVAWFMFY